MAYERVRHFIDSNRRNLEIVMGGSEVHFYRKKIASFVGKALLDGWKRIQASGVIWLFFRK